MYVNYSGWNKKDGQFSYDVFIDENKQDYAIVYHDGFVSRQTSPFSPVTADWNHDGDVYTKFGAWFSSRFGTGNNFFTPEEIVLELVENRSKERFYGHDIKEVVGITLPEPSKPRLSDAILNSELRAMNQEAERNRKMKALGIRRPGEPWAR